MGGPKGFLKSLRSYPKVRMEQENGHYADFGMRPQTFQEPFWSSHADSPGRVCMGGTLGEGSSHADFFAAGDGGGGGRWGGRRGGERGTEVVRILPGEPAWRKPSGRDRPLRTLLGESAWEAPKGFLKRLRSYPKVSMEQENCHYADFGL